MQVGAKTQRGRELEGINRDLAALLQKEPAPLTFGADAAGRDDLIICGILGGKDVGKSTLINALARTRVSADTEEVGRGTERPMAYVHEDARDLVAARLHVINRTIPVDVTMHRADPIRDVVLVDLPDFDSEFLEHLDVVRAVAPLLDRILWVLTPRKIGDRAWVAMLHDVIKDPSNVHCVLNKLDELLADSDPFENGDPGDPDRRASGFWSRQHAWVARTSEQAGCPQTDDHRFLVAAAFPDAERFLRRVGEIWDDPAWNRYGADRPAVECVADRATADLERLRSRLLSPVPTEARTAIKAANRARERQVNVDRMIEHFALDATIERLTHACDPAYYQEVLREAMGTDFLESTVVRLQSKLRPDRALADELLERRVERWPLLRIVYWPFGWVARVVGRRIHPALGAGGGAAATAAHPSTYDPLDPQSAALENRVAAVRSRVLADHAAVITGLRIDDDVPAASSLSGRLVARLVELPLRMDQQTLNDISRRERGPSIISRAGLWLIFLWFPVLQPVAAGLLEMVHEGGAFHLTRGLYRIVTALSATHLLAGFTVVGAIFLALLAAMYGRCLRAVRQERNRVDTSTQLDAAVDELLAAEVALPLMQPFQERLQRLTAFRARLAELAAGGDTALEHPDTATTGS